RALGFSQKAVGISKPQATECHCTVSIPGAVGLSASSNIILGSVGAAVGAAVEQASETLLEFIKQRRDPTEESEDSEPEDDPPNP
ncbi:interferon alpha-inducible protein 27 2-like protein, partial [Cricetulus griseus]